MGDKIMAHACSDEECLYCNHSDVESGSDDSDELNSRTGRMAAANVGESSAGSFIKHICDKARKLYGRNQRHRARELYTQAFDMAVRAQNDYWQAEALNGKGIALLDLGEYLASLEAFEKILQLDLHAGKLNHFRGWAFHGIGIVYQKIGDYKMAIQYHQGHLHIAVQQEDWKEIGAAFGNLGVAFDDLKDYEKAIQCHKLHLYFETCLGDKCGQGEAYGNLGCVYYRLAQYEKAIRLHNKEMEIAMEIKSKSAQKQAYVHLADVNLALRNYEAAIEQHNQYLEIAVELGDRSAQIHANACLGIGYLRCGRNATSIEHFFIFEKLLWDLERQLAEGPWRRHLTTFVEQYAGYMDVRVKAMSQMGDMFAALRVEEWRRCRSELPFLVNAGGVTSSQVKSLGSELTAYGLKNLVKHLDASFVIVFKKIGDCLLTWVLSGKTGDLIHSDKSESAKISAISDLIESVTFSRWPHWYKAFQEARNRNIERKRKGRPLTLEWMQSLINNVFPVSMRSDIEENLWKKIEDTINFWFTLEEFDAIIIKVHKYFLDKAESARKELNSLMWNPIIESCHEIRSQLEDATHRIKPVYFLPDPILSPIPFAAFKVGNRFLIEKVPVAEGSSLRTLEYSHRMGRVALRNKNQPSSEVVLVSYAESDEFKMYENGCNDLSELFATKPLTGCDASKERVKEHITSGKASLIHIMAHGVDVDKDQCTGVGLAENSVLDPSDLDEHGGKQQDQNSHTNIRLMTLNFCSSARGRNMKEGVLGFARASLARGIPCLLAAKWDTPVEESIRLMKAFYTYMAIDKQNNYQTVAEALQDAIVNLLREEEWRFNKNFYYWAAFVPHGFASARLDDSTLDQIHRFLDREEICKEFQARSMK